MADSDLALHLDLVAEIVAAYVGNNSVAASELPGLIQNVSGALGTLGTAPAMQTPIEQKPAVSVRKSVTPDFIICLEDGKPFKSLKRHIQLAYGLTPEAYREKWGLPHDYPMVAPNYSASRSAIALSLGLGRKPEPAPVAKPAPRRKKAST